MATAKKTKAQERGELAPYAVLSRLDHDCEIYMPGDRVELDSATARPLLDVKVIEPAKD